MYGMPLQHSYVQPNDMYQIGGTHVSAHDLGELYKAVLAGQSINNPGTAAGEGFPHRIEQLDRTLRNVTFDAKHIKLWRRLIKEQAYNTVVEYNLREDWGGSYGAFVPEGSRPLEHTSTISRNYQTVKYLATTRRVSHQATIIQAAHGSVVAQETVAGTLWLLRALEQACMFADSSINPLEFDGIHAQLKTFEAANPGAGLIKDARGEPLTPETLNQYVGEVIEGPSYGTPTELHFSPRAHREFANQWLPKERIAVTGSGQDVVAGFGMQRFQSIHLDQTIEFFSNVFIQEGKAPVATGQGPSSQIPAAPAINTQPAASSSPSTSLFASTDAGAYIYKIVAENQYGLSAPTTSSSVDVTAGDKVVIILNNAADTLAYHLYRTPKDGAAADALFAVRVARSVGATTSITDNNEDIPGTSKAFLLQNNMEGMTFKLLAPMMRYPLASTELAVQWAQLIYGTLIVHTPRKHRVIKNLGPASTSA